MAQIADNIRDYDRTKGTTVQSGKTTSGLPPTSGSIAAPKSAANAKDPRVSVNALAGTATEPAAAQGVPDAAALTALLESASPEDLEKLLGGALGGELKELETAFSAVGDELRAAWTTKIVPLRTLPAVERAAALLGRDAVEVFLASPVGAEAVRSLVAESQLENRPRRSFGSIVWNSCRNIGASSRSRKQPALTERIHLTPSGAQIARGEGTIASSKGRVLSAEQRSAVAAMQRWLLGRVLGEDAHRHDRRRHASGAPRDQSPAPKPKSSPSIGTVDTLYATAATLANYRETTVGSSSSIIRLSSSCVGREGPPT